MTPETTSDATCSLLLRMQTPITIDGYDGVACPVHRYHLRRRTAACGTPEEQTHNDD